MNIHITQYLKQKAPQSTAIALSLSFILAVGPEIQHYSLSLLNSEVPSVYGAAYEDNLVQFPPISTWISSAFSWNFLIIAALISIYSTKNTDPIGIAWRTTISSFLALSIFDAGYGIYHTQFSARWIAENLVSNFVGGILIAALLTSILAAADFIYAHTPIGNTSKIIATSIAVVLAGLFICCLAYYLSLFFYKPLKVKFEAYLLPPSSGSVLLHPEENLQNSKDHKEALKFSFFPQESFAKKASWTGIGEIKIKMPSPKNDSRHNVSISLFSGCLSVDQAIQLDSISPFLMSYGATSLEIAFDEGQASLFIPDSENETSKFKTTSSQAILFSLEKEEKPKTLKIIQFVGTDATLEFYNPTGSQTFFLTAPTLKSHDDQAELISRNLKIRIDEQETPIKLNPPSNPKASESVTCSPLPAMQNKPNTGSETITLNPASMVVGVLVTVDQVKQSFPLRFDNTKFHVTGLNGWISLSRQKSEIPEYLPLGSMKMLQVRGNIADLTLDGASTPTRPLDTYTVTGNLEATHGEQGKVRIYGWADRLWRDNDRMNKTYWEKLDWEAKALIATPLGVLFLLLSKLISGRLHTNNRYIWMS